MGSIVHERYQQNIMLYLPIPTRVGVRVHSPIELARAGRAPLSTIASTALAWSRFTNSACSTR